MQRIIMVHTLILAILDHENFKLYSRNPNSVDTDRGVKPLSFVVKQVGRV